MHYPGQFGVSNSDILVDFAAIYIFKLKNPLVFFHPLEVVGRGSETQLA